MSVRKNTVGVVCFKGDDVLLIKRGKAPRKGTWSIPGGRMEPGEMFEQTAHREVLEETGVSIALGEMFAVIDADFEGYSYTLHDFVALWTGGDVIAGDDAAHAEFVSPERLAQLPMWEKTRSVIFEARGLISTCEKKL